MIAQNQLSVVAAQLEKVTNTWGGEQHLRVTCKAKEKLKNIFKRIFERTKMNVAKCMGSIKSRNL